MLRLMQAITLEQQSHFCIAPDSYALAPASPSMQQADEHWLVTGETGEILARCSLWWRHMPDFPLTTYSLPGRGWGKLGLIGHYAAQDVAAAQLLLDHACARLAAEHCTLAIGPLDGNTFRPYRLLTERALDGISHPRFFLEPDNPDTWPEQWLYNGFQPVARYFSAIGALGGQDERTAGIAQRVA